MRKIISTIYATVLVLTASVLQAQISTGTGGSENILANSPSSNTNVGIGTTNPSAKLEVNGDIKGSSIIAGGLPDGQIFSSISERNLKSILFNVGATVSGQYRMFKYFDFPQSNFDAKSVFRFGLEDRSDYNRLLITAETGGFTQFVLSNKLQEEFFKVSENNDIVFMHFPKENSRIVIGGYGDYLPEHKFVVKGSAKIESNILTDGNIGIGTSNFVDGPDSYRLSVKGKIRAEEVKVYNTWADYVFVSDYKLDDLKDVESYIVKNGHLKNVPSAKEITEHGLELGEMSKIQQEKIEELTLYLIQQNKEMKRQNAEIEELKAQVKMLLERK